ncbi:acyl-CoA dehydrogenase family protein [Streptomyces sp. NPDC093990]|uniref:acyl-CoA dehydrogenase family protein n=1 Tax=Streptomyces sp. NPDC093990 TaxID=3155306 RepID=UPI00342C00E2
MALRPALLARQAETERLTHYPEATHDDFMDAGFHRILQPRRYGGHEFGLPVFYRVVVEIARGCPSTGWALSLTAAHVLQVCMVLGERAQDELLAPEGDFRAASTVAPVGVARPDGPGHVVHFTHETSLLDLPVESGSVGSQPHGNPMYAGRAPSFFQGESAAVMIGTVYAADEDARIVAGRSLLLEPDRTHADLHDYQRHLGEALGVVRTAGPV